MMNQNNKTRLFLMICVICALMIGVQSAFAAAAVATRKCTNVANEGIEYFVNYTVPSSDSDTWRSQLTAYVETESGGDAGTVVSLELEMSGTSTRYQCTEVMDNDFSCNSLPSGAVITGVYFRYIPTVQEDTNIKFKVVKTASGESTADEVNLLTAPGKVQYPPYPCSVNELEKDFLAANSNYALGTGESLIYNTSQECSDEHTTLYFAEQPNEFAIVNIIVGDSLMADRVTMDVTPQVDYDYTLTLLFEDYDSYVNDKDSYYEVTYSYDAEKPNSPVIDASALEGITLSQMPLRLIGGYLSNVDANDKTDLWGNPDFPSSTDFDINFYYQNDAGTQGYENSVFHFNRNLNIQFAPYCTTNSTDTTTSGIASSLYDKCQSSKQLFTVELTDDSGAGILVPKDDGDCSEASYCSSIYNIYVETDFVPDSTTNYYFTTRKCADSSCASMTPRVPICTP